MSFHETIITKLHIFNLMETRFADSDGVNIAYISEGEGDAIILLHGGGDTKEAWIKYGYWEDLVKTNKVIAMDIRGNGESDKPTHADDYDVKLVTNDVLAVADACEVDRFNLIAFSFGAGVGKNLAARSDRVVKLVMIGHSYGASTYGTFLEMIPDLRVEWKKVIDEKFEKETLSEITKFFIQNYDLPAWRAIISAMPNWGAVGPGDIKCPVMILYGKGDTGVDEQLKRFEKETVYYGIPIFVMEDLKHYDQFTDSSTNLPYIKRFLKDS